MTAPPPYTPSELADRWKCSTQAIYNLVRGGGLAAVRIGKLIRIPVDVVEKHETATGGPQ
jgi:excisionase family DNA binding protein